MGSCEVNGDAQLPDDEVNLCLSGYFSTLCIALPI